MKECTYTVVLEPEKDEGYHAFCPALPGCHTQAESYDEAVEYATDALKLYIQSLEVHEEALPDEGMVIRQLRISI